MHQSEQPVITRVFHDARPFNLREIAHDVCALDDTIAYLTGIRDYKKDFLKAALDEKKIASSEALIPNMKLDTYPFETIICACHRKAPNQCPNVLAQTPITLETIVTGRGLSVKYKTDHTTPIPRYDS